MSHTQSEITNAIVRSITHDEIVTILTDDIGGAFSALVADADCEDYDYVDTRGGYEGECPLREVWGKDAEGNTWRVHLRGAPQ